MDAKWITCDKTVETPLFRKKFYAQQIQKAEIAVSGLGYFVLTVNGRPVSNDLFVPAQTNYAYLERSDFTYPCRDSLTSRVYFLKYDITNLIKSGENILDVIVGNGWYRQKERTIEGKCIYGESLMAFFEITLTGTDGTEIKIGSDGSEEGYIYPILQSNLFTGEHWDMRLFDGRLQKTEVKVSPFVPEHFELQPCPADGKIKTFKPKLINQSDGKRIYDAGENITGAVKLTVTGKSGNIITLTFAEEIKDGILDYASSGAGYGTASGGKQIQCDSFILRDGEQQLMPMFVWHGFRYFDISGDADITEISVCDIHTNVPLTSEFRCDSEPLMWLYRSYVRTQLNNYHGGVPLDCPHRERLGYTGDGQICAPTAMMLFDCRDLYLKWIRDIMDCQCKISGHVQHTAPFLGGGGGPGGWGCAIVFVPWAHFTAYGDRAVLKDTFPAMEMWAEYMLSHCEDGLLVREEEGGWCLGDWAAPGGVGLPPEFVNTCLMIKCFEIMSEISEILCTGSADRYKEFADISRRAAEKRYYADGEYLGGIQGANAYAVYCKLPNYKNLIQRITDRYNRLKAFDTGFIGTDILCDILVKSGNGNLALELMASENTDVGFAFMRKNGATTLYEELSTSESSHDHPMFGACTRQLMCGLLGIRQTEKSFGYESIIIEPLLDGFVRKACGSIMTVKGRISVRFSVDDGVAEFDIPKGVRAVFKRKNAEKVLHEGINNTEII